MNKRIRKKHDPNGLKSKLYLQQIEVRKKTGGNKLNHIYRETAKQMVNGFERCYKRRLKEETFKED